MLVFVYQAQCRTQICLGNFIYSSSSEILMNICERSAAGSSLICLGSNQGIISVASLSFVCLLSVDTVRKEAGYLCNCFNRPVKQR